VTKRPPGDLPPRLEQAVAREVAAGRGPRRRRRLRSLGLPVVAAVAAAAASAGAISVFDGTDGTPIAPERGALGAAERPADDPAVVVSSAAANPNGGPPWVARVFTNAAGGTCIDVGRLRDGEFGEVQQGRFRVLPRSAPGTCGRPDARGALIADELHPQQDVTIVFGIAVDRDPVTIAVGERRRRVRPAGLGAFVAVFPGADPHRSVVVRTRGAGPAGARRLR
jgi:hypothetical protein